MIRGRICISLKSGIQIRIKTFWMYHTGLDHRRRIKTEELKAKVVASVLEEEFIKFLDVLAVLRWRI